MAHIDPTLIHISSRDGMLIEIRDEGEHRTLYFDGDCLQSQMSLSCPYRLTLPYTRYMMFPMLYTKTFRKILLIGVGAGSLLRFCRQHIANCRLDGVDNSPHILDLARGYFQCPEDEKCVLHCSDGCEFLEKSDTKYDLILVDAFDHTGMAPAIYNEHFLGLCATHLSPTGSLAANLWSGQRRRLRELKLFFQRTFHESIFMPVPDRGNVVAISTIEPFPWQLLPKKTKEIQKISRKYDLEFKKMIQVARRNNLSISKRLAHIFT